MRDLRHLCPQSWADISTTANSSCLGRQHPLGQTKESTHLERLRLLMIISLDLNCSISIGPAQLHCSYFRRGTQVCPRVSTVDTAVSCGRNCAKYEGQEAFGVGRLLLHSGFQSCQMQRARCVYTNVSFIHQGVRIKRSSTCMGFGQRNCPHPSQVLHDFDVVPFIELLFSYSCRSLRSTGVNRKRNIGSL